MTVSFTALEHVVRRAPLGLRCVDMADGQPVSDERLVITARHVSGSGSIFTAYRSPISGIYGFNSLPGLYNYEWDLKPASSFHIPVPPLDAPQRTIITVEDRAGRYLPQVFQLLLPREQVELVPLFSAPARPVPASFGVVRATLWDSVNQQAAAWALLTATVNGSNFQAMADARGVVALWVLYPTRQFGIVSGADAAWPLPVPVTITINYQPGAHISLPALPPDAPPDRASLLGQAAATFDGGQPSLAVSLPYRQDYILKTDSDPQSRQHVEPAPI